MSGGEFADASQLELVADADSALVVVARFLALLELFGESAVMFEQEHALGELTVAWVGRDQGALEVSDEFDVSPRTEHGDESDKEGRA